MASPQETQRRFELNPKTISPKAVENVAKSLGDEPANFLDGLTIKWGVNGSHFREFIHPEFQVFRIGTLGWKLSISDEDRAEFGIEEDELSGVGPDSASDAEVAELWEYTFDGINTMRAVVISAFIEEASIGKMPPPDFNSSLIDPHPAPRDLIPDVIASRPGLYVYDTDELDRKWQEENPELHQLTIQVRNRLAEKYTLGFMQAYTEKGWLPQGYLAKVEPQVRKQWEDYLMEYAYRTYAMLTPQPPQLIEVARVEPRTP